MDRREWQNSPIFTAPAVDFGPTDSGDLDGSKRIASLETRLAAAEEACTKKDEALKAAKRTLDLVAAFAPPSLREKAIDEINLIDAALSLTPPSVAQQVEDARIGRDVVEWLAHKERNGVVLRVSAVELKAVIAQAEDPR
jgi:hypothetical protein